MLHFFHNFQGMPITVFLNYQSSINEIKSLKYNTKYIVYIPKRNYTKNAEAKLVILFIFLNGQYCKRSSRTVTQNRHDKRAKTH